MDDSTHNVDWEKVEAIMVVIGHSWDVFGERREMLARALFSKPFSGRHASRSNQVSVLINREGTVPNSYVSIALPSPLEQITPFMRVEEPYNITGTWLRIVCFLNYHELFAFNFAEHLPSDQPRPPLNTEEATRFIIAHLRATKVEPPGKNDGQELPVVYFTGISRSTNGPWDANANSNMRGSVRMTKDGHVRWTTFSIYDGYGDRQ